MSYSKSNKRERDELLKIQQLIEDGWEGWQEPLV